ncbi:MAG: Na+/H+ antiporter subunit B [Alphaproteobacteria bacterium]
MNSLILRTITPMLVCLTIVFSIFVLLRGHNEPGGGFIGGLMAVGATALYGLAFGPEAVRRAISADPLAVAGTGLFMAIVAGLWSLPFGEPFMTGQWKKEWGLSTPLLFDIGVYLVVVGGVSTIALSISEEQNRDTGKPVSKTAHTYDGDDDDQPKEEG